MKRSLVLTLTDWTGFIVFRQDPVYNCITDSLKLGGDVSQKTGKLFFGGLIPLVIANFDFLLIAMVGPGSGKGVLPGCCWAPCRPCTGDVRVMMSSCLRSCCGHVMVI